MKYKITTVEFMIEVNVIESVNKWHMPVLFVKRFKEKISRIPYINKKIIFDNLKLIKPIIAKSPEAAKAQNDYHHQFNKMKLKDKLIGVDFHNSTLFMVCYFKKGLRSRDSDNCLKLFQDSLFRYLGVDDNCVVDLYAGKRIIADQTNTKERIFVKIIGHNRLDRELKVKLGDLPNPGLLKFEYKEVDLGDSK